MFSTRTMRPADWAEITAFAPSEFNSPDAMGYEFMRWLNELRTRAGVPIHLTSDYRSPERNAGAAGAKHSAHMELPCNAVDIGKRPTPDDPNWNRARFLIVSTAMQMGCTRVGFYPGGSLHIDRSEDTHPSPRLWTAVVG